MRIGRRSFNRALTAAERERPTPERRATGATVTLTELDVDPFPPAAASAPGVPPAPAANPDVIRLPDDGPRALAQRDADAFRVFVRHRDDGTRVAFLGVSDADSWRNRGRVNHPLPWDGQPRPTPALDDVKKVLVANN